jgi:hypothetical protein
MTKKLSHKEVNYRKASSAKRRCGTCTMYRSETPPDCTAVKQPIRPMDVCDLFIARKETMS